MRRLTWDETKRRSNLRKHGLDFAALVAFDAANAMFSEDVRGRADPRFVYPERRFYALGQLHGDLVTVVYARVGDGWHIISLRPASRKERKVWLGK
jgi:uncharacterized DUF497 family protein